MNKDIYSPHRKRSSLSGPATIFLIIIVAVFILSIIFHINGKFQEAIDPENELETYFAVKSGDDLGDIAENLEEEGFIDKKFYFSLYIKLKGSGRVIKADLYKLSPSLSMSEIAKRLLDGEGTEDNEITIIEGWTLRQVASKYAEFKKDFGGSVRSEEELEDNFLQAASDASDYDYSFLASVPQGATLEGFLFPDTYELYQDAEPEDLINKMLVNFQNKISDEELVKGIEDSDETLFDIITLASIVQKEVQTEEDMKGVAGVYYNRLVIGRKLESDVTVNYVTGKNDPTPSYADTDVYSPYNTYQNEGLPPGPVANPGLMAIRSTVFPAEHEYYYFLTRLDTGEALFSTRGYEHEAKKEKYLK